MREDFCQLRLKGSDVGSKNVDKVCWLAEKGVAEAVEDMVKLNVDLG